MRKSLASVFLLAWVMWLQAEGKWLPGQAHESKTECDSQIPVVRERTVNSYNNLDWKASNGQTVNAIDLRNVSTGQIKTVFLVCYPSDFSPK